MPRTILSLLSLILCLLPTAHSAAAAPADSVPELRVSLLTCAPGKEVYQLEGHTALRLTKSPATNAIGYDLVVNWGVFDFATPNFIYRFVKGETDYMACAYPFNLFMEEYRMEGREVVEQVLDLTPEQAGRLEKLVSQNILPENRTYRYNYVKDNCATRPLAMVEAALGSVITLRDSGQSTPSGQSADTPEPTTFRKEMTRYHRNYPWYQFGIDLALGSGIDHPVTRRQQTFAPVFLRDELEHAAFTDSTGMEHRLVRETLVLNEGIPGGVECGPTPMFMSPIGAGIILAVVTFIISCRDIRRRRLSRWFDTLLFTVFFLAGCVLCFLVFVSSHEATSPNWLLLWLNPLCIIPAVGIWIKRCERVVYCYQICNFAALILLMAGHHFFGQALNAAFPLFILCDLMRSATQLYLYGTQKRQK